MFKRKCLFPIEKRCGMIVGLKHLKPAIKNALVLWTLNDGVPVCKNICNQLKFLKTFCSIDTKVQCVSWLKHGSQNIHIDLGAQGMCELRECGSAPLQHPYSPARNTHRHRECNLVYCINLNGNISPLFLIIISWESTTLEILRLFKRGGDLAGSRIEVSCVYLKN